jgi:TRAP-type mannitol/chloroaromatic compound transport system substrate-binding protein
MRLIKPMAVCALLAVPFMTLTPMAPASAAEVVLKGISAWPKSFPLTAGDFLLFIEEANKRGKGHFKIKHIGGPEISKAPAQSKGFKSGLYDLMHTAASYHRGVVPEVDALSATQLKPWDARKNGAMKALNSAISKRINGIMLAHMATSVSFNLYLRKKPEITADGVVSLKGFKMRSVPVYDAFLKSLGATTITVHVPEIYNALERGLVDGIAFPNLFTRKFGWNKFTKYTVFPSFYQLEPSVFIGNKALAKLTPKGREIMLQAGEDWEKMSWGIWRPQVAKERQIYKKGGTKEIIMNGAAAKKYLELANTTPVERLKKVGSPESKILSKLYHGQ